MNRSSRSQLVFTQAAIQVLMGGSIAYAAFSLFREWERQRDWESRNR